MTLKISLNEIGHLQQLGNSFLVAICASWNGPLDAQLTRLVQLHNLSSEETFVVLEVG